RFRKFVIFFSSRRRHTRSDRDWSSDVCSSDLTGEIQLARRGADLASWISPLLPIRDASSIVLKLLREGGKPVKHVAHRAAFSQMLGGKMSQMVRIRLPRESQFIPEISANRYALNVRFSTFGTRVCEADVEFELTFCNL